MIWVAKFRRLYSPKMISKPPVPLTGRLKDSGLLDLMGMETSQYQGVTPSGIEAKEIWGVSESMANDAEELLER